MATEREVKIRVDSVKLEEITGFLRNPEYFSQENIIYQNSVGFLRLRKEKGHAVITYKGPRRNDKVGSREETEISVQGEDNFKVLRQIFEKMGLAETFYYNKLRACFDFGPCSICLDQVRGGDYIEIEGRCERDIVKAMKFFNLNEKDIEKRSYQEILGGENGVH